MSRSPIGRRVARVNDHKPLEGTGRYLDDIDIPGMLYASFLRSPVPHGVVTRLDLGPVPAGVVALGRAELEGSIAGGLPVVWRLPGQWQTETPVVEDTLRHVGQPVGLMLAPTPYAARDAVESAVLDIEDLPAVTSIRDALNPGSVLLYPELGSNVMCDFAAGDPPEHTEEVFRRADDTLTTTIRIGRLAGIPMEGRGCVAVPEGGRLTVYTSSQAPHVVRETVSHVLGVPQTKVRVVAPDVGGAFGMKDHMYEDEMMVVLAAVITNRPVKWVEDRQESLIATAHGRDEEYEVAVAFADDGTLLALRVDGLRNGGARLAIFGGGPLFTCLGVLPGPYRWEAYTGRGRVVATNTMSTAAYRGFGQTQASLIRERIVDLVAARLGVDRVDLRLKNMIRPEEQPYQTRSLLTYDNGDYSLPLRRAREMITGGPPPPDDGRARGIGYCSYVQLAGVGPSDANKLIGLSIGGYETGRVRVEPDGSVTLHTGVSPHGQGLETTLAQLVAAELGVDVVAVTVIHSDTDQTPHSAYGTAASRSIAVGGGAALLAAREVAGKMKVIAAALLEAHPDDIRLVDGRAVVTGTDTGLPLAAVAQAAASGFDLPDGVDPGLEASRAYDPASATFSFASHACRVAVDRATGLVDVEDYVVVNDCGVVVNPAIVEGQIHGGVAQGLGAAILEEVVYGEDGHPLTSTLMDYLAPVSSVMPQISIEHQETPSPHTPGGMKGMGEGGTNGSFACVVNAIADAVPEIGEGRIVTPLTPLRLWQLTAGHRSGLEIGDDR